MTTATRHAIAGALFLLASAADTAGQPTAQLFGGGSVVFAKNGSDEYGLPSDGRAVSAAVGASVARKDGGVLLSAELDFPRTMTTRVPGAIKAGPVTYVITQRPWVASAMIGHAFALGAHARVEPLVGASLVGNAPSVRYSFQTEPTLEAAQQRLAWSGGVDLLVRSSRVVFRVPRVRLHYVTGMEREFNGFGAPRVLWSVGTTIGWQF